ncbi:MAG: hypothetical protein IPK44_24010 [Candidatus Accumulibacter sp.]|uniref:hypothetical protein n=1 Tax=Accumulibacter sp. TaxID=2053492 RepID=UPI00259113A7|nr:hypothetical protein [Accumulibacter sp.]MBK8117358.1 hypothetical protein [Accumulibacter sp.]
MRATPAAANPYFAPAGSLAQFFVVSEAISTDDALEGASMFLAAAADLGNGVEDGGRWAISCFAEIAKALVDTVIEARIPPAIGAPTKRRAHDDRHRRSPPFDQLVRL